MGEINVVKQALWRNNLGFPVSPEKITKFAPFMNELQATNMPILLHCDLGSDAEPTKYLTLMDQILSLYPSNKIIWAHFAGISKELTPLRPKSAEPLFAPAHVKIIRERLKMYPNLLIDLSWDVLYNEIYSDPVKLAYYVDLVNEL